MRSHRHRAVRVGAFETELETRPYVVLGPVRPVGAGRDAGAGMGPVLIGGARPNLRLVEMDMGIDKTRPNLSAIQVDAIGCIPRRRDGGDAAVGDPDIDGDIAFVVHGRRHGREHGGRYARTAQPIIAARQI